MDVVTARDLAIAAYATHRLILPTPHPSAEAVIDFIEQTLDKAYDLPTLVPGNGLWEPNPAIPEAWLRIEAAGITAFRAGALALITASNRNDIVAEIVRLGGRRSQLWERSRPAVRRRALAQIDAPDNGAHHIPMAA